MKKIIINGNHTQKLTDALAAVQSRCTARTLTVSDVERILEDAFKRLSISKKALAGTRLEYSGAEHFASAYKYMPESTQFVAEYDGRHWCVLSVSRSFCPDRESNTSIKLSESAQAALVARFSTIRL